VAPLLLLGFGALNRRFPMAYLLAIPLYMRSNGVYFSIAVAESAMAATSAILFKQGSWKRQKI
jgi:Na+-driven multidrug efflux pump